MSEATKTILGLSGTPLDSLQFTDGTGAVLLTIYHDRRVEFGEGFSISKLVKALDKMAYDIAVHDYKRAYDGMRKVWEERLAASEMRHKQVQAFNEALVHEIASGRAFLPSPPIVFPSGKALKNAIAAERERCAKVAEDLENDWRAADYAVCEFIKEEIAAKIREGE